jgi:hypothetical protein
LAQVSSVYKLAGPSEYQSIEDVDKRLRRKLIRLKAQLGRVKVFKMIADWPGDDEAKGKLLLAAFLSPDS